MMKIFLLCGFAISAVAQEYWDQDYEDRAKKAEGKAAGDGKKVLETGYWMTIDSAWILPGSCWDYANAVYQRAGYGWGQRENVFKSAKTGPYVDAEKIQYGDWLYYINHSYGDIEHSAIFVEWLDKDKKIALMLSYGGERRREPARYMPYELTNVYGITRANAKLGGSRTDSHTMTTTDGKNAGNSGSQSRTIVAVSGVESAGMKVDALKFGTNVQQMEVVGEGTSFPANGKVYCWLRVTGGQGKFVKLKWYRSGVFQHETKLDIVSNSMRTYSYKTVTGMPGEWSVEAVDARGTVLHAASFHVQ